MLAMARTGTRRRAAREGETKAAANEPVVIAEPLETPKANGSAGAVATTVVETTTVPDPPIAAEQSNMALFTATGVRRLDDLLGGGIAKGSTVLAYGAPYCGKGTLQRIFFLRALRAGIPAAYVLTDTDASEMSSRLEQSDPAIKEYERAGLVTYIDGYSTPTGGSDRHPNARPLENLQTLDALLDTISALAAEAQAKPAKEFRLAIQSVSTLLVEAGPARVFKFLRALTGRLRRANASALLLLEAGMHPESDVQAMKHLCAGMIHMREVDEKYFLRVEGLRTAFQPGWIEYSFSPTEFDLTGSFASERIRSTALGA